MRNKHMYCAMEVKQEMKLVGIGYVTVPCPWNSYHHGW